MATSAKKSWREKLADAKDLPKLAKIKPRKGNSWGLKPGDTMIIPAPLDVDVLMKRVGTRKLTTTRDLQRALAEKHGTTTACPICTGIFAWIAAHAAEEERAAGKKRVTPYWRTLKTNGEINPKYPGGVEGCAKLLRAEGHKIVKKGERMFVVDFEKAAAELVSGRS